MPLSIKVINPPQNQISEYTFARRNAKIRGFLLILQTAMLQFKLLFYAIFKSQNIPFTTDIFQGSIFKKI